MTPLRIDAYLTGGICLPNHPIALDALLEAAVAARDGIEPPATPLECRVLPVPLAEERGVRLCTVGMYEIEQREAEYTNRRFPLSEAQDLGGPKLRRIDVGAGATKSYRLPRERLHLRDDRMTWWTIGDAAEVRALLHWITGLGKRRAVGIGEVREWRVEETVSWGDGFPVLRDGAPMRTLPADWPGLAADAERAYATLTPPYWDHARRQLCAVPSWQP